MIFAKENAASGVKYDCLEIIAKLVIAGKLGVKRKSSHKREPYYNQKQLKVEELN